MSNHKDLEAILKLVSENAGRKDAVGAFARQLETHLVALQGAIGVRRPSRRGVGDIEYWVEGDVLTEHRLSGKSMPLRCPKAVYDACAAALSAADQPLAVDQLVMAAEQFLGSRPPEFQVRVPLRLWMHMEQPLVTRSRARYAVSGEIKNSAANLWLRLS